MDTGAVSGASDAFGEGATEGVGKGTGVGVVGALTVELGTTVAIGALGIASKSASSLFAGCVRAGG